MLVKQSGFSLSGEPGVEASFAFNILIGCAMVICFLGGAYLIIFALFFGDVFNIYQPDMKFTVRTILLCVGVVLLTASTLMYIFLWRRR